MNIVWGEMYTGIKSKKYSLVRRLGNLKKSAYFDGNDYCLVGMKFVYVENYVYTQIQLV